MARISFWFCFVVTFPSFCSGYYPKQNLKHIREYSTNKQFPGYRELSSPQLRGGDHQDIDSTLLEESNLKKAEEKIWKARRDICRAIFTPISKHVKEKKHEISKLSLEEKAVSGNIDAKQAFIFTATVAAISATILRVGGRAAFTQFLGLDFFMDESMKIQINDFITQAESFGDLKYLYFFIGWMGAKLLCIDAIPVVLAMSSGIFFGGVWEGALLSTACATGASLVGFFLGRTILKERVKSQLEKRPALRAIDRAVSQEGFKTVLTLRLAPVLPIPIGAYNYVYGATSLSAFDFCAGMFLGSFKPYLLDAYLGVFGKSILDGSGDSASDYLLIVAFAATVLVGALSTQIATKTWNEMQNEESIEMKLVNSDEKIGWQQMWGVEESSFPKWYLNLQHKYDTAQKRIKFIIDDEWSQLDSMAKSSNTIEVQESYEMVQTVPPKFTNGSNFAQEYVFESTAFTFVLLSSIFEKLQVQKSD